MKLQARLSLTTALITFLAVAVMLLATSFVVRTSLETAAHEKLQTVQAARHQALTSFLTDTQAKLSVLATSSNTIEALQAFNEAYQDLGANAQFQLQQKYVVNNSYGRQERDRHEIVDSQDRYDLVHGQFHASFRHQRRLFLWDDLLLIDPQGNVVYSLLKEKDFATNLLQGPWKNSGLAKAIQPLLQSPATGVFSFADFSPYEPSNNQVTSFLALPMFDKTGRQFLGVIALQVPSVILNRLMQDTAGLGVSGETLLVGQEGWMLTDSRFEQEHLALRKPLKSVAVKNVLMGESGILIERDYRNISVLISFEPIKPFAGALGVPTQWGVLAKIDESEALQSLSILLKLLLGLSFGIALLASLVGASAAHMVSGPIVAIRNALTRLSQGEAVSVPGLERHDEIGGMAAAAENFRMIAQQIERNHWLNEQLTGLTNLVSSQFSTRELPDTILNYLCGCLGVPVAALYFADTRQIYTRVAMHGLARRNQLDNQFSLGVGLVGQCARDAQPIVLAPVPEGLTVISTGLTEFAPEELVLYPIRHKNRVLAVLELAVITPLTPQHHEFLLQVSDSLGVHLANLQAAEHNLVLLNETRKQADILAEQQQKINESSRYARSLFEASLDPLVTINAEGIITDVNSATERVTGVAREELINSEFSLYFTEPELARIGYRQVFLQGSVIDYPLAIRHVSGKITDVLYNASVYHDSEGKVAGIFAAARDVTELKQQASILAEQSQRIKEASRYARSLLEAGLDPLVTISADGRIMDVNRATERITGMARELLIGSDFSLYFTDPEQARSGYREVFSQGSVIDYPLAIRHVSGQITYVLYNASIYYDAEGAVAGVFAVARDVTELNQQQEALRLSNEEMRALSEELKAQNEEFRANQEELRAQQEEMQQKNQLLEVQSQALERARLEAESRARELGLANQYKSDFLANMSHELRTPLNSILILARNLAENEEANLTTEQVESASVINDSGSHLLALINDILDLSKIEAGRFELFNEEFSLLELMTYLQKSFTPLADQKAIGFSLEMTEDLPSVVQGDRQRIVQVLTNLLSNAVKFTDSGHVKIKVSHTEEFLRFDVSDTGIGIPADKLNYIFGVFQQIDGSISRKYGGSGLGLAISKRLIELMGGAINVFSEPGRGSTFSITLPHIHNPSKPTLVQVMSAPVDETPLPKRLGRTGEPILVVEDDQRLTSILERLIDTLGFTVAAVASGEKALEFVENQHPVGIIMDLGLPGIAGIEVLRMLKNNPLTSTIPVFIMSGAQDNGEAKNAGALGYLKKPITKDNIAAAIRQIIEYNDHLSKTVLVIEDNPTDILGLQSLFQNDPVQLISMSTGKEAMTWLQNHHADAIILDLMLPDTTGFDWLQELTLLKQHPRIIIHSARDLSGDELFELRQHADTVVTKGTANNRLREEVLLLLNNDVPAETVSTAEFPIDPANQRLLLVDDDVRNLFALAKVLRQKGFMVEIAPSGAKALEILEQHTFSAVLSDIMMPEMDGYALIQRIRELGYAELPLIAVTAKAMPGDIELCLQAGANDYIPKPVDINKLLMVLAKWL